MNEPKGEPSPSGPPICSSQSSLLGAVCQHNGTAILADENGARSPGQPVTYIRPTTRGELAKRLAVGEECEVVSSNAEITAMMLRGWLDVSDFDVRPSTTPGWVIFFKTNASGQRCDENAKTSGDAR